MRKWDDTGIAHLRAAWEGGGTEQVMATFSCTRSQAGEMLRRYLGIRRAPTNAAANAWTPEFVQRVAALLKQGGVERVQQEFGWTRHYALEVTRNHRLRKIEKRTYHVSNDLTDQAIRNAYLSDRPGAIKKMAEKNQLDYGWVRYRARCLGVRKHKRSAPWTEPELLILESLSGSTTETISRALRQRGFERSLQAINAKMIELGLSRRARTEGLTASDVARIFGVDGKTVLNWLQKGWLCGQRKSYTGCQSEGGPCQWFIRPRAIKTFIRAHRYRFDLHKVQQDLFLSILFDVWQDVVILPDVQEATP